MSTIRRTRYWQESQWKKNTDKSLGGSRVGKEGLEECSCWETLAADERHARRARGASVLLKEFRGVCEYRVNLCTKGGRTDKGTYIIQ